MLSQLGSGNWVGRRAWSRALTANTARFQPHEGQKGPLSLHSQQESEEAGRQVAEGLRRPFHVSTDHGPQDPEFLTTVNKTRNTSLLSWGVSKASACHSRR